MPAPTTENVTCRDCGRCDRTSRVANAIHRESEKRIAFPCPRLEPKSPPRAEAVCRELLYDNRGAAAATTASMRLDFSMRPIFRAPGHSGLRFSTAGTVARWNPSNVLL